jgi:acetyl-CoA synthetase
MGYDVYWPSDPKWSDGGKEIEGAIVRSGVVAEAAVVGAPHDIKGQGVCAFCVLKPGITDQQGAKTGMIHTVKDVISPIASSDWILFVSGPPKTRSGKIMRRILRKVAKGEYAAVRDATTLAEPAVVEEIVAFVKGI